MVSAVIGVALVNFRSNESTALVLKGERFLISPLKQGTQRIINCVGESFIVCQKAMNTLYGREDDSDPLFEIDEAKHFGNRILLNKFAEYICIEKLENKKRENESLDVDVVLINSTHLRD